jgi:peptidoglycan hydrolase-like protein with peptidoglycan-binding domain
LDRDLARVDLWEESLRRSRERRERAAAQAPFELRARGLSVTAILALAGVPATAFAAGKVLSGGGDSAAKHVAIEPPRSKAIDKPARAARVSKNATQTGKPRATDPPGQTPAVGKAQVSPADQAAPAAAAKAAPAVASGGTMATERATTNPATATAHVAGVKPVAHAARRGGGVVELQRTLGVPADGDFGPRTERALKRWQRRHGLTADGIAGPQTREALGLGSGRLLKRKRAARHRAHRRHHSAHRAERSGGGGVRGLQQAIGVSADGVFGPDTELALKRWQEAHGLAADGVAGPQTRQALGLGPGPVLKRKGSGGGGGNSPPIQRVIAAANRIATAPYKYGGGHGSFTDSGYDCSGSVSYALHGGGLLSSPLDSGALMSYGAPGPGRHITIYANSGHAYMTIDGRRFDTSARSETGSRWTNTRRGTGGYTIRHPRGL